MSHSAGITTFAPLRRHCKAGMAVGVIGIGGLGHLALQFAAAMGCTVTAISTSDSKRAEAIEFGASKYVVSSQPDSMAAARSSLDVILNTVRSSITSVPHTSAPNGTGLLYQQTAQLLCMWLPWVW